MNTVITTEEAEQKLDGLLRSVFNHEIISQWPISRGGIDSLSDRDIHYCPRLDFAIGPFNIDLNVDQNKTNILNTYRQNRELIGHLENFDRTLIVRDYDNPRCFIAIEIERSTGTKHRMGSIINAGALGKVGIVVGLGNSAYNSLIRIREYLKILKGLGKTKYEPKNVLILRYTDFVGTLEHYQRN